MVVRITIAAMIGVTTDPVTIAMEIGIEKKELIAVNALGHLLVVLNMTNVAQQGLHLPEGRLMIEGLQGTRITDGEVMMIATEYLIITLMTVAGMITTDEETTGDVAVKTKTIAMKKGLQRTQTGMEVGVRS